MKSQKGITLITLVIIIVVLVILTFTISINAPELLAMQKKNKLKNDIDALKEEIDQYYARYDSLPIINKYTNIDMLNTVKNVNDNENYYVIDLSKISVDLNYGKDYEDVKAKDISEEITDILDVYIINEQSHTIYYPKGIEYDGKIYYNLDDIYYEINTYLKVTLDVEEQANKIVTLTAKGIDVGGIGIESYEFYIDGTLIETITTTDQIATCNFNTIFGDYTAYVILKDQEGNEKQSDTISFYDYTIATVDELVIFRDNVNAGTTYEGKTITLLNDIDLSNVCGETIGTWMAIGNNTNMFKGIFEGNSNTIENLYVNSNLVNQGLFGVTEGNLQNLNMKNVIANSTNENLGTIAGRNGGIIENVNISSGTIKGYHSTAGIAGYNYGIITLCTNNATITYDIERTNGIYNGWKAGGIVGTNNDKGAIISKCINNGTVIGTGATGGICGEQGLGEIKLCVNTGNIESNKINSGYICLGGIVGTNAWIKVGGYIENCYNIGNIKSNITQSGSASGGIAGSSVGNGGKSIIENCYSIGMIEGTENIGGVIGNKQSNGTSILNNNYWLNTCGAIYGRGNELSNENAQSKTQAELKELVSILGDEWTKDVLKEGSITEYQYNNGYPILKWQLDT